MGTVRAMDPHSRDCPIDLETLFDALGLGPDTDRELFRVAFDCGNIYGRVRARTADPDTAVIASTAKMWRDVRMRAAATTASAG